MTKKQRRPYNAVAFLEEQIEVMKEDFSEKEIKHEQALLSLEMILQEKDREHYLAVKEMRKLRENMLRFQDETDQLKLDMRSQKENLRRCKENIRVERENLDAENQSMHENLVRCLHENDQLKLDLESHMEKLRILKDKNRFEQEKLNAENQNMHEIMLRCQRENDLLKLDLRSLEERLRRCSSNSKTEQEKLNMESQMVHGVMLRCQHENEQLKLDLESQKGNLRRCKENYMIEQEKLISENQNLRESVVRYQQENDRLKLDLEFQNENLKRVNDKNRNELEKLSTENQKALEDTARCQYENEQLKQDMEFQKENLRRCKDKNKIEQEKLNAENKKLKARIKELERECALANPDGTDKTSELKGKMNTMSIELDKDDDQMQDRKSLNQSLMVELQKAHHELEGVRRELIGVQNILLEKDRVLNSLKIELEDAIDDTQAVMSINQVLLVKERMSTAELHKARQQLITGLSDFLTHRTNIGIKRMGELDQKPFRDACLEKISGEDSIIKSAELCSLWERNVQNPQWHPFKRIRRDGKLGGQEVEAVDDDDENLKELKNVWGEHVYEAVSTALSELNDYNPSGRYPVPELWNFKEGRRSDLREVIEYLIKQMKSLKSTAKTLKRRR